MAVAEVRASAKSPGTKEGFFQPFGEMLACRSQRWRGWSRFCRSATGDRSFPRPAGHPIRVERLLVSRRHENRERELAYFGYKPFQFGGVFDEAAPTNKCPPLNRPCRISIEGIGEPNRFLFDVRAPMPEGGDNRLDQKRAFERVQTSKKSEIVIVLHAAVQ